MKISKTLEVDAYRKMKLIRDSELLLAEQFNNKIFKTPIHLAIGQEAIPVGISMASESGDLVFGNHRSHGHFLAFGGSVMQLFAEILGKRTGCSKGKGGSMHLSSPNTGFLGSMPIVGSTIPVAVGTALALKMQKKSSVVISFFGDGATEEGVFHESLNLAKILSVPILFACENNEFSSHLHLKERQPSHDLSRFAKANKIEAFTLDGNEVSQIRHITLEALNSIRNSSQPIFLEFKTYRQYGHVGGKVDSEIGLNRSEDLSKWANRDPIKLLRDNLIKNDQSLLQDLNLIDCEIQDLIKSSWESALTDPYPSPADLYKDLFYGN